MVTEASAGPFVIAGLTVNKASVCAAVAWAHANENTAVRVASSRIAGLRFTIARV